MVSLTLAIPAELKKEMKKYPYNWSEAVRVIIERKLRELKEADEILSKSKFSEKDAKELAAKVNAKLAKHFKEITNATNS